jgi:hypothetical protein
MGAPSSYSKNLGLELIATGAKAGTWGTITNRNLDTLDDSINGMTEIFIAASPTHTLTTIDGAISPGHSKVIRFAGGGGGDCVVTIDPDHREHVYFVANETTERLIFQQGDGSGGTFTLDPPYAAVIHCNGVGATSRVSGTLANLQVSALRVLAGLTVSAPGSATLNNSTFNGTSVFGGTVTCQQGITVQNLVGSFQAGIAVAGALGFSGPMTQTGTSLVRFTGLVHMDALRLDAGGDQPGDMYFRSAGAGLFQRIPPGTSGSVLTYGPSGPAWGAGGLAINMPVAGFNDRNILGVQAGQLRGTPFWWNTVSAGVSRNAGFVPLFDFHIWAPAGGKLMIDGTGGEGMGLRWGVNALLRWEMVLTEPEIGGNSGSNLTFITGNDAGGSALAPMRLVRATGNVIFGNTNVANSIGQVNIFGVDGRQCLVLKIGPGATPSAPALQILRADGTTCFVVNNNGDVGGKSFTVI